MTPCVITKEVGELQLGDVVRGIFQPIDEFLDPRTRECLTAYGMMTVINVTETEVTFYRPFVHTSDFTTVSGLIPYIGIEEFKAGRSGHSYYELLESGKEYK